MGAEQKLQELGLEFGPVGTPVANFLPAVRTGNLPYPVALANPKSRPVADSD